MHKVSYKFVQKCVEVFLCSFLSPKPFPSKIEEMLLRMLLKVGNMKSFCATIFGQLQWQELILKWCDSILSSICQLFKSTNITDVPDASSHRALLSTRWPTSQPLQTQMIMLIVRPIAGILQLQILDLLSIMQTATSILLKIHPASLALQE